MPLSLVGLVVSAAVVLAAPVKLIIDTDAGLDVDDVVAICVGNALQINGEAEIIAIAHTNGFDKGIGGVSSLQHWYSRDDVPLGSYKGEWANSASGQDNYLSDLVNNFPGPVHDSGMVPTTVQVYRKALAAQPDHSVHIASIGITTNLRDLVQSPPDQYSALSGSQLVGQKVALIVWMDGGYNFGCAAGMLNNEQACHGSAKIAVEGIPSSVQQIFTGLGGDILSGSTMPDCAPKNNPCRRALDDWPGPYKGRSSWDPITVMVAVRGARGIHCKEVGQGGHQQVDENGHETWVAGSASNQTYLQYDGNTQNDIKHDLDALLCQPPGPTPPTPAPAPTPPRNWTAFQGANCWDGHGGHNLENPPDSSCGHMSIVECKQRCIDTQACSGITVTLESDGTWSCFRKSDIDINNCDQGTKYDTYTQN